MLIVQVIIIVNNNLLGLHSLLFLVSILIISGPMCFLMLWDTAENTTHTIKFLTIE